MYLGKWSHTEGSFLFRNHLSKSSLRQVDFSIKKRFLRRSGPLCSAVIRTYRLHSALAAHWNRAVPFVLFTGASVIKPGGSVDQQRKFWKFARPSRWKWVSSLNQILGRRCHCISSETSRCRASVIADRPRPAVGGWTSYRGTAGSQFWLAGELWSCYSAVIGLATSAICFDPLEVYPSLLSASRCPDGLISTASPFSLVLHTSKFHEPETAWSVSTLCFYITSMVLKCYLSFHYADGFWVKIKAALLSFYAYFVWLHDSKWLILVPHEIALNMPSARAHFASWPPQRKRKFDCLFRDARYIVVCTATASAPSPFCAFSWLAFNHEGSCLCHYIRRQRWDTSDATCMYDMTARMKPCAPVLTSSA